MDPTARSWAEIRLDNIEHNFRTLQARLPEGSFCLGVVKADSYGHGALPVAIRLETLGCGYLAVATPVEAARLREGGITLPILILGPSPAACAPDLATLDVTQAVGDLAEARAMSAALRPGQTLTVHAKLETGMGRTGFPAQGPGSEDLIEAMALPGLDFEGVFTHFAMADVPGDPYTLEQYRRFRAAIERAEEASGKKFRLVHCSNSGAVIHTPTEYAEDMARPGIALYGLFPDKETEGVDLRPVMALKSRVAAITHHKAGDTIGYGRTYTCPRDMRVAVLPLGYGDGLHRTLSNQLEVELCGVRVKQIGRICMDLCMLDVTDLPQAQVGSVATVFGGLISADELADKAGTISYELCCAVNPRVPRVYLG
ncbi:MAG: alanine racemase [Oscillospiraceae bacterium]|nr:alanine racemase [Oscillospiraceae bacterium]